MERLSQPRVSLRQGEDGYGVGTVDAQTAELVGIGIVPVNVGGSRHARLLVESTQGDSVVDAVLGHVAVGSPFAARDGEQAGVVDMDGVVARDGGGLAAGASEGFCEGADTDENAENVFACGLAGEVAACGFENKLDLLLEWERLVGDRVDRCIRRPDERAVVPWDGEEYAAVVGLRDEQRGVSREKERSKTR